MIRIVYTFKCDVHGCGKTRWVERDHEAGCELWRPVLPPGWVQVDRLRVACHRHVIAAEVINAKGMVEDRLNLAPETPVERPWP